MECLGKIREAVEKLCAFLQSSDGISDNVGVENLFVARNENHFSVDVEVAFLVSPPPHRVPLYILLPHEIMSGSICLITSPPQRFFKDKILALSEEGDGIAKRVARVIDTEKLRVKFVDPVTIRAFANSYDNFVVYGVRKYPPQLSGEFLGHQRLPVWIAKKGPLAVSLLNATRTAVVSRRGNNAVTCSIGHTGLSIQQLEDNIKVFIEKLTHHPQGATIDHVLHIRVAGTNSKGIRAGLPVYSHVFTFDLAKEAKRKRPHNESAVLASSTC